MSLQLNSVARFSSPTCRCGLLKSRLRETTAAYTKDHGDMELNDYWQEILVFCTHTQNDFACVDVEQEEVVQGLEKDSQKVQKCRVDSAHWHMPLTSLPLSKLRR